MKVYAVDGALLAEHPVIKIRDLSLAVDNRAKVVRKLISMDMASGNFSADKMDEVMEMLLGPKQMKAVDALDLSFATYNELFATVIAAATDQDPEEAKARFQKAMDG